MPTVGKQYIFNRAVTDLLVAQPEFFVLQADQHEQPIAMGISV